MSPANVIFTSPRSPIAEECDGNISDLKSTILCSVWSPVGSLLHDDAKRLNCIALHCAARTAALGRGLIIICCDTHDRYTCMDTTAALAAGTLTVISRPDECATSLVAGAHAPNSSTLTSPSVMPALASAAGPLNRMTDEPTKLRSASIVTRTPRLNSLLIRQTRK